jgi:peptide/nickel transport system permease protein
LFVAVITLVIVSFAVFFATTLLPGDTATILLGQAATPEAVEVTNYSTRSSG